MYNNTVVDKDFRKFSSAGRASALQAEGHRFEPYCSHQPGLVVQLARTPPCHGGGREFEPHPGRLCGFSSSGRAPPCQGGGSEFEPRNPLYFFYIIIPKVCFRPFFVIERRNICHPTGANYLYC